MAKSNRSVRPILLLSCVLSWPLAPLHASIEPVPIPLPGTGTLLGAEAALDQINARKSTATPSAVADPLAELKRRLAVFRESNPRMAPDQAARAWLDLADRFVAIAVKPPQTAVEAPPVTFSQIIEVLPSPAAWPALARIVEARQPHKTNSPRDLTLSLLAHVLTEEKAKQWKDLAALRVQLDRGGNGGRLEGHSHQLAVAMAIVSGDKQRLLQITNSATRGAKATPRAAGKHLQSVRVLPDLVSLQGRSKAEATLRQALLTGTAELDIPLGDETRRLARQLALSLAPRLRAPQWRLAQSTDSTRLFKAMEARFVTPGVSAASAGKPAGAGSRQNNASATASPSFRLARTYYLLGLIAQGRQADSVNLATRLARYNQLGEIPPQALESLDKAGHTLALNYFLRDMLMRNPSLPLWGTYITTAARAGRADVMLAMVRKSVNGKGLKPAQVMMLRARLYQALLAADRVDEGVGVLRGLLVASKNTRNQGSQAGYASQLVRLGKVTNRPAWVAEGLRVLPARANPYEDMYAGYAGYEGRGRIAMLIEVGRDGEAEKDLVAAVKRVAASNESAGTATAARAYRFLQPGLGSQAELTALAGIYHRRGRHRDVLDLLEGAQWWGAKDLGEILTVTDSAGTPLGYMAAAALAAVGREEESLAVTRALLNTANGYDPGYALLVRLLGEKSLPVLDELFAQDRFEERPLIWKAAQLLKAKRLEEAEAVARQAIAIDPSDGEQGKGDRMRVYAVLADIRAARGDAAQAATFRGAVKAIRLSESADDFYSAGLLSRAIKVYKQALTHFSDAYCIQSRLAIQLAAAGRMQEATEHYTRAYELMPDSFGRMESHCFGCEGAFQGQNAATLADSVFKRLLVKSPNKPQLHYLVGYLRSEQKRPAEALVHYRRATRLDPDYINAWSKILETGEQMQLPQADRDAAVLNLLRLDPTFRHSAPNVSQATNLKQLWQALTVAQQKRELLRPGALLPLTASIPVAAKLAEERTKQLQEYGVDPGELESMSSEGVHGASTHYYQPGRMISRQIVIAALVQIMDARLRQGLMSAFS